MPRSYRLTDCNGFFDSLTEARFAARTDAEQVQEATEFAGDGYFTPEVLESEDEPNTTAVDFMAGAWPEWPGPCPAGTDPEEWYATA